MNKLTTVSVLVMGLFAQGVFAAGTNNAGTTDGTITFTGVVTDSPCTVSTSSVNQTVPMGQIKTSDVTGSDGANLGSKTAFNIKLEGCDATWTTGTPADKWTKLAVKFTDNASPTNDSKKLQNTGTSAGVTVGLLEGNGTTDITLGTAAADITPTNTGGPQILPFYAHFVKDGTAAGKAGTIEAKADFIVEYK